MTRKARWLAPALCAVLFLSTSAARAAVLTISWSGVFTDVTEFRAGAAPAGVSDGVEISGTTTFDTAAFTSRSDILGNNGSGVIHRYGGGLTHTVRAGGQEWLLSGSDVILAKRSPKPISVLDVLGTSERHAFTSFPGYVGTFVFGYGFFDDVEPYGLFDSMELDGVVFTFEDISAASGMLTTRLFDDGGDIVDGYYAEFAITAVRVATVPEPSAAALAGVLWAGLCARRWRGHGERLSAVVT